MHYTTKAVWFLVFTLCIAGCNEAIEEDDEDKSAHRATSTESQLTRTTSAARPATAEEAFESLIEGNSRFVAGEPMHPHDSAQYRASLVNEQHPFATVLACSDSRVTPELIFDQGIGDRFVIRVAGNVVDDDVAGSIEYAVDHLGTKLLVVMGHEHCGAVTAAYHSYVANDMKEREPHEIDSLLHRIEPAMRGLDPSQSPEDQIAQGIENQVRAAIEELSEIPDLRDGLRDGRYKIMGAIYSLHTGEVRFLDEFDNDI
ncbi:carbonic anhydrase [Aeoliella mucimassa]|uniref:Carbonic anhydrase n=1 Tax=Aeoliella mucimassa TaxID=2527972 RepID=A0A518ATD9_9BACT|nr:carbonic anhydrase [Aeoliella mucimassa]QDU57999.1 Carbonic anhydrase [Aeoliella mucimassa]